jgi:PAS domain S-box-containing protein
VVENARMSAPGSDRPAGPDTPSQAADAILDHIGMAVIVRGGDGGFVYANQAAADLLGLADPEAIAAQSSMALMTPFDVYDEAGSPIGLEELPGSRLLAGEPDPPPLLVRNVARATGVERWLLQHASAVRDGDGRVTMAVNLIEDVTETKRNQIAQGLLAAAARAIAESDDVERTLQAIADAAVPGLADWAGADLVDQHGRIATVAIAHRDPEKVKLGWRLRTQWPVDGDEPGGLPDVIRTGVPQVIEEVTDEMVVAGARDAEHLQVLRAVGLNSTMIVPIRAGQRVLGALSFVSSTSRRFDRRDLDLAEDLGRQAGVLIANAQLNAERARIAHILQVGLLPERLPEIDGWDIDAAYRAAGAANEVGGDFYDVVAFDGGFTAIVGDVVGKGAQAAVLTALARHTIAAIVESTGDTVDALRTLNRRLREHSGGGFSHLCTIATVTITGSTARIISAGHPPPLLVRDGTPALVGTPGLLLGAVDDARIAAHDVQLIAGDRLLLYTDGVTDTVGTHDRFGERRLLDAVAEMLRDGTRHDLAAGLLAVLDAFAHGEQADDIAIVALRDRGAASRAEAA